MKSFVEENDLLVNTNKILKTEYSAVKEKSEVIKNKFSQPILPRRIQKKSDKAHAIVLKKLEKLTNEELKLQKGVKRLSRSPFGTRLERTIAGYQSVKGSNQNLNRSSKQFPDALTSPLAPYFALLKEKTSLQQSLASLSQTTSHNTLAIQKKQEKLNELEQEYYSLKLFEAKHNKCLQSCRFEQLKNTQKSLQSFYLVDKPKYLKKIAGLAEVLKASKKQEVILKLKLAVKQQKCRLISNLHPSPESDSCSPDYDVKFLYKPALRHLYNQL
jgi:hypothetical protein